MGDSLLPTERAVGNNSNVVSMSLTTTSDHTRDSESPNLNDARTAENSLSANITHDRVGHNANHDYVVIGKQHPHGVEKSGRSRDDKHASADVLPHSLYNLTVSTLENILFKTRRKGVNINQIYVNRENDHYNRPLYSWKNTSDSPFYCISCSEPIGVGQTVGMNHYNDYFHYGICSSMVSSDSDSTSSEQDDVLQVADTFAKTLIISPSWFNPADNYWTNAFSGFITYQYLPVQEITFSATAVASSQSMTVYIVTSDISFTPGPPGDNQTASGVMYIIGTISAQQNSVSSTYPAGQFLGLPQNPTILVMTSNALVPDESLTITATVKSPNVVVTPTPITTTTSPYPYVTSVTLQGETVNTNIVSSTSIDTSATIVAPDPMPVTLVDPVTVNNFSVPLPVYDMSDRVLTKDEINSMLKQGNVETNPGPAQSDQPSKRQLKKVKYLQKKEETKDGEHSNRDEQIEELYKPKPKTQHAKPQITETTTLDNFIIVTSGETKKKKKFKTSEEKREEKMAFKDFSKLSKEDRKVMRKMDAEATIREKQLAETGKAMAEKYKSELDPSTKGKTKTTIVDSVTCGAGDGCLESVGNVTDTTIEHKLTDIQIENVPDTPAIKLGKIPDDLDYDPQYRKKLKKINSNKITRHHWNMGIEQFIEQMNTCAEAMGVQPATHDEYLALYMLDKGLLHAKEVPTQPVADTTSPTIETSNGVGLCGPGPSTEATIASEKLIEKMIAEDTISVHDQVFMDEPPVGQQTIPTTTCAYEQTDQTADHNSTIDVETNEPKGDPAQDGNKIENDEHIGTGPTQGSNSVETENVGEEIAEMPEFESKHVHHIIDDYPLFFCDYNDTLAFISNAKQGLMNNMFAVLRMINENNEMLDIDDLDYSLLEPYRAFQKQKEKYKKEASQPLENRTTTVAKPNKNAVKIAALDHEIRQRRAKIRRISDKFNTLDQALHYLYEQIYNEDKIPSAFFVTALLSKFVKHEVLKTMSQAIIKNDKTGPVFMFIFQLTLLATGHKFEKTIKMLYDSMEDNRWNPLMPRILCRPGIICPPRDLTIDGDVELNPGPTDAQIRDMILEINRIVQSYPEFAGVSPNIISELVRTQPRHEASVLDKLINSLVLTANPMYQYLGPAFTGGTLGPVNDISELAHRILALPADRVDELAREHDVAYSLPIDRREADQRMVSALSETNPILAKAVEAAFTFNDAMSNIDWSLLSATHNYKHDLTQDGDVEANPGPINLEALIKAVADWLLKNIGVDGAQPETTPLGRRLFKAPTTGTTVATQIRSAIIATLCPKTSIFINDTAVTLDVPLDFNNVVPLQARINNATVNLGSPVMRFNTRSIPMKGPATVETAMVKSFSEAAADIKSMYSTFRTNTSMFSAPVQYTLWILTNPVASKSNTENIGSNGQIWANILNLAISSEITFHFMSTQNCSPDTVTYPDVGDQSQLFPGIPDQQKHIYVATMTIANYTNYVMRGRQPILNNTGGVMDFKPNIVFMTSDQLFDTASVNDRIARSVWIAAHGPYPAYANDSETTWKSSYMGGNPDSADLTSRSIANYWRNDPVLEDDGWYVIIVLVNSTPSSNSSNLPTNTYDFTIGSDAATAVQVRSRQVNVNPPGANNNPTYANFTWVDATDAMDDDLEAFCDNDKNATLALLQTYFAMNYQSKDCLRYGYVLAAMRSAYWLPPPVTTWTSGQATAVSANIGTFGAINNARSYAIPQWTNATYTGFVSSLVNPLQSPTISGNSIMYDISQMPELMQCALVSGNREVDGDDRLSPMHATFNVVTIFQIMFDISQAMMAFSSNYLSAPQMSLSALLGTAINNISEDNERKLRQHVGEKIFPILAPNRSIRTIGYPLSSCNGQLTAITLFTALAKPRFYIDKAWESTTFYTPGTTAGTRKVKELLALGENSTFPNATLFAPANLNLNVQLLTQGSPATVSQVISMLQPLPNRTAIFLPVPNDNVLLYEQDSSNAFSIALPFITPLANNIYGQMLGPRQSFVARTFPARENNAFIDFSISPLYGRTFNKKLRFAFTSDSNPILSASDTANYWQSQKAIVLSTLAFVLPSFSSRNEILDKLLAAKKPDKTKEEKDDTDPEPKNVSGDAGSHSDLLKLLMSGDVESNPGPTAMSKIIIEMLEKEQYADLLQLLSKQRNDSNLDGAIKHAILQMQLKPPKKVQPKAWEYITPEELYVIAKQKNLKANFRITHKVVNVNDDPVLSVNFTLYNELMKIAGCGDLVLKFQVYERLFDYKDIKELSDFMKRAGPGAHEKWYLFVNLETLFGWRDNDDFDVVQNLKDWLIKPFTPNFLGSEEKFYEIFREGIRRFFRHKTGVLNSDYRLITFTANIADTGTSGSGFMPELNKGKLSITTDSSDFSHDLIAEKNKFYRSAQIGANEMYRLLLSKVDQVCNVSIKTEFYPKVRLIVNSNFLISEQMRFVNTWLDEWMKGHPDTTLYSSPKQKLEMWDAFEKNTNGDKRVKASDEIVNIPLDQAHFDWHVSAPMINIINEEIYNLISDRCTGDAKQELLDVIDLIKQELADGGVAIYKKKNTGEDVVIDIKKGVLSGWTWTALYDTAINYAEGYVALQISKQLGFNIKYQLFNAQGDDQLVTIQGWLNAFVYFLSMASTGLEINFTKNFFSTRHNEYLRKGASKAIITGYPARMINGMCWIYPGDQFINNKLQRITAITSNWEKLYMRFGMAPNQAQNIIKVDLIGAKLLDKDFDNWYHTPKSYGGHGTMPLRELSIQAIPGSARPNVGIGNAPGYADFIDKFGAYQERETKDWFLTSIKARFKNIKTKKLSNYVTEGKTDFLHIDLKPIHYIPAMTPKVQKPAIITGWPSSAIFGQSDDLMNKLFPNINAFIERVNAPKSFCYDFATSRTKTVTPNILFKSEEFASLISQQYDGSIYTAMFNKRSQSDKWARLNLYKEVSFSTFYCTQRGLLLQSVFCAA